MTTQPKQPTQPSEVSIDEAARILGISPATVRRRVKQGRLQAIKATTTTGFIYRIRLPDETSSEYAEQAAYPESPERQGNAQIVAYAALEAYLDRFRSELATLADVNATQGRRIEEQAEEIGRLKQVERELAAEQARLATSATAIERENARLRDAEASLVKELDQLKRRSWWDRLRNRA